MMAEDATQHLFINAGSSDVADRVAAMNAPSRTS
jgi:hypothetical protein